MEPTAEEAADHSHTCRHCGQPIALTAKVCHLCSRHQNRAAGLIAQLANVANLLSVGVLVLSLMQFNEARKKTAEVDDALNKATAANTRAENIEKELLATKTELEESRAAIRKTTSLLLKITKANMENYLIMTSVWVTHGNYNAAKVDENMDMFSKLIEPNKAKRELWLKSLRVRATEF